MQIRDGVEDLHNGREFSHPLECLYQAMQTQEKVFYCFYKITIFALKRLPKSRTWCNFTDRNGGSRYLEHSTGFLKQPIKDRVLMKDEVSEFEQNEIMADEGGTFSVFVDQKCLFKACLEF